MKVKYLPWQPHCLAFGGLEVQMLSTLKAVQLAGVSAEKLDVWSRDNDFDILHVWGLDHVHEVAVHYAVRSGKKVIITALFQDFNDWKRRYKHYLSQYIGIAKCMIKIAQEADKIVVVNDIEADIATKFFKIPTSKISYIPNIVDTKYFETESISGGSFRGIDNYVLCTGNICRRKNQLTLVKACISIGVNLVLIGKILPGEEEYGKEVLSLLDNQKRCLYIENLPENSDELISAYRNCSIFALPSLFEQGPISAYEALVVGTSLLIADRRYSYQEFYQNVKRVDPFSVKSTSDGIRDILNSPRKYRQHRSIMDPCRSENVGIKYKDLYQNMAYQG